ncbi:MAG: hypothetical protein MJZ66_05800 [Bacteroidales bacterium]|nr:hypothetical protein [Bacteroidales bacterium]
MKPSETVRQVNAQLRYYLHIAQPDSLTDDEWARAFHDLVWIRQQEAKYNKC